MRWRALKFAQQLPARHPLKPGGWCWAAVLTLPVQNARCVHVGFSTASDIAVDQWLRLGAGVAGLKGGVSAVPTCSLFVDPASSSKLCFKGSDGVVHPLY